MVTFQELILLLEQYGLSDVLLPFLLIYVVVFAILEKSQILGAQRRFNVVIALVMALLAVIPHVTGRYPYNADIVNIINTALPNVAIFIIAIVMILLLIGLWGGGPVVWQTLGGGVIALLAFVIVAIIFVRAAGVTTMPYWLYWLYDPGTLALLIMAIVFIIIIAYVTGGGTGPKERFKEFIEGIGKMFQPTKPGG